ncbi:MAG: MtrB/PioB family outer membrane beta-barrel protein [Rubrivivax sp.]|nr:MtrB/PioB family outer membrane beta-barrel protein [Rubrivivax sp.]
MAAGLCLAAGAARADSSLVWPVTGGNGLNPAPPATGTGDRDPVGLSPYRQPASRSPWGRLYDVPYALPEPGNRVAGWEVGGFLQIGVLGGSDGGRRETLLRTYRDVDNGPVIERFELQAQSPGDARYVEVSGGGLGRRDAYVGVQFGRYNDWRVSLRYDETPHVSAAGAQAMWLGVGTGMLTLPTAPGVAAGGASANNAANAAAVQALIRSMPPTELAVVRRTGSARLDLTLADGWTLNGSYSLERRRGARAFGANEGNGETVEPIDHHTHELRAGVQYADGTTQLNVALAASLFRNAIDTLTWQNPFRHPSGALNLAGGRMDLVPDNEAYQAKVEFAQVVASPWRARFTAVVDVSSQRQNDRLIPPTLTSGTGAPFGNAFNGNYDLWNTTAALSRERADARIDTRLVDLGLALSPLDRLTVRATLRRRETRNHTAYTAYNPLAGLYGYIIQDTNPSRIYTGTNDIHYRSIPFEGSQDLARVSGEWRMRRAMVAAEVEREDVHRAWRERERTREDRLRLSYSDRGFESLTLQGSYEHADRRGSDYVSNPYRDFYTETLPGYRVTTSTLLEQLHNLEELRKFDLADRRQQTLRARVGWLPRPDLDLGLSLQARLADYPAEFGRVGTQSQRSVNLDAGWLPATTTAVHAHLSRQTARMQQADAADLGSAAAAGCLSLPPSCSNAFGVPRSIYPAALAWGAQSGERTTSMGLGLRHDFGRPRLELQAARVKSRSPLAYDYASADALQSPSLAAQSGTGFADIAYEWRVFDMALRMPVTPDVALRLFLRRETVRITDWHATGLDAGTVVGNRVYLDAGPGGYRATLVGVSLQLTL